MAGVFDKFISEIKSYTHIAEVGGKDSFWKHVRPEELEKVALEVMVLNAKNNPAADQIKDGTLVSPPTLDYNLGKSGPDLPA